MSLPESTVTPVVVLAVLGFPIALALAWTYDLTWGGIERTAAEGATSSLPAHVPVETSERSIVVLPFDNLSPDLD